LLSHNGSHRILLIRPDRLGDVLLTTPVIQALKQNFPNSSLTLMTQQVLKPLFSPLSDLDDYMTYDPSAEHLGVAGLLRLRDQIKEKNFDIAITFQSHFKISTALFLSGVTRRVGPFSKLHSFLLLNHGVFQKRSEVKMHESQYNLDLLKKIGIKNPGIDLSTQVSFSSSASSHVNDWLIKKHWNSNERFVVVHPGMGGSALNWPEKNYIELIRRLLKGYKVCVTGGRLERNLLMRIKKELNSVDQSNLIFFGEDGQSSLEQLAALFSRASVVVAPSTGPLHLAVALKRPVVTFFSPIKVQSPKRWGPYSGRKQRAFTFVPDVLCPAKYKCIEKKCNYFPCMQRVSVDSTLKQVEKQLLD